MISRLFFVGDEGERPFPPSPLYSCQNTPGMIFDIACAIRYNRSSMPPSTGGILSPTEKSGSNAEAKVFYPLVKIVFCLSLTVSLQHHFVKNVWRNTAPLFVCPNRLIQQEEERRHR